MITYKKITKYNLFVKWPRIMFNNFIESHVRKSVIGGILFTGKPVILKDYYDIRFVLYPYSSSPLEKIVSRRYLKDEFAAIELLVKPGDIIFDVGAHIGLHSVFMSQKIGCKGKIYAFEPVLKTYWELKETIALNKCDNIIPINSALFDSIGKKSMHIFQEDNSEWNSFGIPATEEDKPIKTQQVDTTTLEEFVKEKNISCIDFIKIDAEGTEKNVLNGAVELLKNKQIKFLSFEISQLPLLGTKFTAKEIFAALELNGYLVYEFNHDTKTFIGPISDSQEFHKNYYASYINLSLM